MQPASGFKETGATLKQMSGEAMAGDGSSSGSTDGSGNGLSFSGGESVTMPIHAHYGLGYLGASLGNQAFHSAAASSLQQQKQQQQQQWNPEMAAKEASGGSQRFQEAFQEHLENMQHQHNPGGSEAVFPTSVIGSLTADQQVPHPLDLDATQEKVFKDNPELFKQFQQQAAQIAKPPTVLPPLSPSTVPSLHNDDLMAGAASGSSGSQIGGDGEVQDSSAVDRDAAAVMRALGL